MLNSSIAVLGRTQDGGTVWYTGRAGAGFISTDARDAFRYSVDGARARALMLNRGTQFHGIRFVAVVGDAAPAAVVL
jgi:hypothetical protein